jgi:hypothetical protein
MTSQRWPYEHTLQTFLEMFKKNTFQHVPLLVVKGEYEQKVLDFLLTEVQKRQNRTGIHKGKNFRFKAFCIEQLEKYMFIDHINRNKITRALKSVRTQINSKGIDIKIPKYEGIKRLNLVSCTSDSFN